jgi:hypothetical protein
LELAGNNREATPGKGARSTSPIALEVEQTHPSSMGVELDTISEEDIRGKRSGTVWRR